MKPSSNNQRLGQDSGYPLITRERTDKLDLLRHLTANLARTVILCGPEGVGKTRLLNQFKASLDDSTIVCSLKGDSLLSLEKIQEQIAQAIALKIPNFNPGTFSEMLGRLPRRGITVIVILDNAGDLAPGIMEHIISYANDNPMLRVIFALTHSELYLKNSTDSAIDDCYQIEIPPLTELQCADFLEYLSTLPNPRVDFNAINEVMIADLYRKTHGIPGRILDTLPQPPNVKKLDYSSPILIGAVIGLIAIALAAQWWSSRPKPLVETSVVTNANQQPNTNAQAAAVINQQPQQSVQTPPIAGMVVNDNTGVNSQNTAATGDPAKSNITQPSQTDAAAKTNINTMPAQIPVQSQQPVNTNSSVSVPTGTPPVLDESGQWVMQQPAENITLQLMALYDQQATIEVMQRHQALGQNLRYLKTTTKRGKDRFILLYGSFSSPEQAREEAKNLPKELQKTWPRKMNAIQAELNAPAQVTPTAPLINQTQ